MKCDNEVFVGIIISHKNNTNNNGYGFKITFNEQCQAQDMKTKIIQYLKKQGYNVNVDNHGYYDKKEED